MKDSSYWCFCVQPRRKGERSLSEPSQAVVIQEEGLRLLVFVYPGQSLVNTALGPLAWLCPCHSHIPGLPLLSSLADSHSRHGHGFSLTRQSLFILSLSERSLSVETLGFLLCMSLTFYSSLVWFLIFMPDPTSQYWS